jgi:hypothetical protein
LSAEGAKPVKLFIWNTTTKTWEKFDGAITASDIQVGAVEIKNYDSDDRAEVDSSNALAIAAKNKLVPEYHDYIGLTYTGSDLTTVEYKSGGSGGTTVATLTLAYTSSVLDSVTKT